MSKISPSLNMKVQERDNFTCQYCGADGSQNFFVWRHLDVARIDPKGGEDATNLAVACHHCNMLKKGLKLQFTAANQKNRVAQIRKEMSAKIQEQQETWLSRLKNRKR